MENDLLFEHLINDNLSKCIRWADLYRGASVVKDNGEHDMFKVGETHICLYLALSKLKEKLIGEQKDIVENCIDTLCTENDFDTIDNIITSLSENYILF